MIKRDPALAELLMRRKRVTELSEALGISRAAISQWVRVPEHHLAAVSAVTGVPRRQLRPDLYPTRSREPAEP